MRENGRAVMSSEESCGSSSDDDSVLWTEEFDEELESISLMEDEVQVLYCPWSISWPLHGRPPPLLGKGPFCNVM